MEGDERSIQAVINVCNVSRARSKELLDAVNGNVERAVDVHFQQQQNKQPPTEASPRAANTASEDVVVVDSDDDQQTGIPSKASRTSGCVQLRIPLKRSSPPRQQNMDFFIAKPRKRRSGAQNGTVGSINLTTKTESTLRETSTASSVVAGDGKVMGSSDPNKDDSSTKSPNHPWTQYSLLSDVFATMTNTTKRTIKIDALKGLFETIIEKSGGVGSENAKLLIMTLELTLGELHTTPHPQSLQVSGGAVSTAVRTVFGASRNQVRQMYRKYGDLGDVAAALSQGQKSVSAYFGVSRQKRVSVQQVHQLLSAIATVPPGTGSQTRRQQFVVQLLQRCKEPDEIRFVVRTLLGNMRLGATIKTVLAALARAVEPADAVDSANACDRLQDMFALCPRIPEIAKALLRGGVSCVERHCSITVGYPIEPMLAKPAHSLDEVASFLGQNVGVAEWKYDGVRCQAHWDGKDMKLYSRHLRDCTAQYPEVVQFILDARRQKDVNFILDGEIVAIRKQQNGTRLLPFQELTTGKAGNGESKLLKVFCFDLMYLNNESLINTPLWKRQALLREVFSETEGYGYAKAVRFIEFSEALTQSTLQQAVKEGAEGLMIKLTGESPSKTLSSSVIPSNKYQAGARSPLWLKLKRDYVAGDSIDVVPIGAWYGNGRKAQNGFLSPVLLAIHDDGVFYSISRCMSFTDDMYRATREHYFRGVPYQDTHTEGCADAPARKNENDDSSDSSIAEERNVGDEGDLGYGGCDDRVHCLPAKPGNYVTNETPSIWFQPHEVWEVSFADLSLSRVHTAALGYCDEDRGIALRFPRFLRRRPDKSIDQASTSAEVAQLYKAQAKTT